MNNSNQQQIVSEQFAALVEAASAIEDAYKDILQMLPEGSVVPDWILRLEYAAQKARAVIAKTQGRAS